MMCHYGVCSVLVACVAIVASTWRADAFASPATQPAMPASEALRITVHGYEASLVYTRGVMHCSLKENSVRLALSQEQQRKVGEAAAAYLSKPGPFYVTNARLADGKTTSVIVSDGDRIRSTVVYGWAFPPEMEALLQQLGDTAEASQSKTEPSDAASVCQYLFEDNHYQRLSAEEKEAPLVDIITVQNDEPERLIGILTGKPHALWNDSFMFRALGRLALVDPKVAEEIRKESAKHPDWDAGPREDLLTVCALGGSKTALRAYANLHKSESQGNSKLQAELRGALDEASLGELARQAKVDPGDMKASPLLWQWAAANADVLEFDPAFGKYRIPANVKLTKPKTPAELAEDAKKIARILEQRPLEIKFDDIPLEDSISFISEISGKQIEVDWLRMEDAGVSRTATVKKLRLRNASVGAALTASFRAAAGRAVALKYMLNDSGDLCIAPAPIAQ